MYWGEQQQCVDHSPVQQRVRNISRSTRRSAGLFPLYLLVSVGCALDVQSQYPQECAKQPPLMATALAGRPV